MEYNLQISTPAQSDILLAVDYYDLINPRLTDRFLSELFETYLRISQNPEQYSYISSRSADKLRDIKLKSFPYVVVHEIHDSNVIVIAILNTHRKPMIS